jgi:nucleobase transporter 1/2
MSTSDTSIRATDLNYGLDDVPEPFTKALGLGLQHVLTMFGATIAVPLLLGPAMGFDTSQMGILVSSVFIASGIATILQLTIGSRLPIVQGVSFAFLVPFFAIIASYQGAEAMQYIAGAILVGAIVEAVVGFGGLFGVLKRFITPITIGPVIALIGLSLFGAASGQAGTNWWLAGLTIALIFVFSLVLAPRYRMFSLFPILAGVLGAYAVAWLLTVAGVWDGTAAAVTFDGVGTSPWVRNIVGEQGLIFPWGGPQFDIGFIIAVLAAYMASAIESFGDYHAVARVSGVGTPTAEQVNRGIGSEGLGCFITGLVGGFASTSYSENIGLVGLTKVASRYVVMLGAIVLIVLGFVTKIGSLISTIPGPIVGGLYCVLFGLIAMIGLTNLQRADMNSQRNLLIAGFILFMGLVIPSWIGGLPQDWTLLNNPDLTRIVQAVGGSGIAVAAVFGIILDNIIPGTDRERGIVGDDEVVAPEQVPGDAPGAI